MGKRHRERGAQGTASPSSTPTPFWRVVALPTLGAMALVASVWAYTRSGETPIPSIERPSAKKVRALWEPITAADRLVDAFREARNADPKATTNLAPEPVFDDRPVSETEAEAMQSHYILHRVSKVLEVRYGEPGEWGVWLDTPHRFTLTTRAEGYAASAPKVAVKVGDRVGTPTGLTMLNPDIVVEVRDGRIHALRAENHRD